MRSLSQFVLPGSGFRAWLVLVAVAAFTGIAVPIGVDANPFIVGVTLLPMDACFVLFSLWPVGAALWVSVRHFRRRQPQTAAAYGLVPVVAAVIAIVCQLW